MGPGAERRLALLILLPLAHDEHGARWVTSLAHASQRAQPAHAAGTDAQRSGGAERPPPRRLAVRVVQRPSGASGRSSLNMRTGGSVLSGT